MISFKYSVHYYQDDRSGRFPVKEYIESLSVRERSRIHAYLCRLVDADGYLEEPYSRHIAGGIRELRVDFARNHHRIFYFAVIGRRIILLHAFLKKTPKTPQQEIVRAQKNHDVFLESDQEM